MKNTLILAATGLVLLVLALSPFFIKVKIICKSQFGGCPVEIQSLTAKGNNKTLSAAKREIKKNLSGNYLVSDFSFQFKLPDILTVNLIVKKSFAAIVDTATKNAYLIGTDGKILSVSQGTTLPAVFTDNINKKPGDNVESGQLFSLKLISGVFEMYQVRSGILQNNTLLVELPAGTRVIFPLEGDTDILLGSLRLIYSRIQSADYAGKYKEIDLRFKNPVLR